ncbi:MAG: Holliday junction resolvase RuvX [Chloroflexota bacterium]
MRRLIGIDHGSRRIGLAMGDTETRMAFARPARRRTNERADLEILVALAATEGADGFVIGLPLLEDGSEGAQAARARAFGERLAALAGCPVTYADERYTSTQARADLDAAGRWPSRASGELDSAAARLILQQYLDDLACRGHAGSDPHPITEEPA